jgi:hypothetical protein
MLTLRPAFLVVTGVWLVNQGIGFGLLHYPMDPDTIVWGFVIGLAALPATLMSCVVLRVMPRDGTPVALATAFLGAYCAHELVLFAATLSLAGAGSFTAAIVVRLDLLDALWLIGLVVVGELVRHRNSMRLGHAVS